MDEGQHGANGGQSSKVVRCGIYTRKSTEEGLSQPFNSLDAQREAAEAYIASQRGQGWMLIPTRYDDGGFSGSSLERPALQQLLADVDNRRVDCVVVYKVDRLSRSLLDFARIMERFDQRAVNFVSITQQFNTTTSLGRLTLNILLSFAQFEREIIGERTRDKLSAARRKGKWVGGTPPLGYDVAPERGRLIINEAEASQVREIFALYAHHRGLIPVVEELNHRGWITKHWTSQSGRWHPGQPFGKQALVAILKNVTYIGRVNYKGTIYPGEQPAVVAEELWQRVNEQLLSRGFPACHSGPKDALLKGLLWCEPCGASMILSQTSTKGRSYRYYVCMNAQRRGWAACPTKSVKAALIEYSVVEQLSSFWRNTKASEPDREQQACLLREVVERIVVGTRRKSGNPVVNEEKLRTKASIASRVLPAYPLTCTRWAPPDSGRPCRERPQHSRYPDELGERLLRTQEMRSLEKPSAGRHPGCSS